MPTPFTLSDVLESALVKHEVDQLVIEALRAAVYNAAVDITATSYASGLDRSYQEYGMNGVKFQVLYLVSNMGRWQGVEARQAKKVLRRWSSS